MIRELESVRADGRVIDESMTLDLMIESGWGPSKVIEISWRWDGQLLRLKNHFGLLVMVSPDRQRMAVLWNHDAEGLEATLFITDGDNRQVTTVPGELMIHDKTEAVTYVWFEHSEPDSSSAFICICTRNRDQATYRVDIDAVTANVLSVRPYR